MPHCVAIAANLVGDAKIDSEAGDQSLHAARNLPTGQDVVQTGKQARSQRVDVVVETGLAISGDGGEARGDRERVPVVCAAVLAISLGRWAQPTHITRKMTIPETKTVANST